MAGENCPKCGGELRFLEKDTSSGEDWRTYGCAKCGEEVRACNGIATWKALSDARAESPGGRFLAVRREPHADGKDYAFYFVNDTAEPILSLALATVGYGWGDHETNAKDVGRLFGPIGARDFILAWRDDSDAAELRLDLRFHLRLARGEATLMFEVPRLYRREEETATAPLLGKALFVGAGVPV